MYLLFVIFSFSFQILSLSFAFPRPLYYFWFVHIDATLTHLPSYLSICNFLLLGRWRSLLNQESLRYNISKSPVTIYLRANIYAVYRIFSNNCKTLHSNSATVALLVMCLCTLASSQANSGTCSHVQDKCFYSKWSMIDSATTITLGN